MRDPQEELRRFEEQLARIDEDGTLQPRRKSSGSLSKLSGMSKAALAVGTLVIGLVIVSTVLKLLPFLIVAGVVYGVYRLFYAPDRD